MPKENKKPWRCPTCGHEAGCALLTAPLITVWYHQVRAGHWRRVGAEAPAAPRSVVALICGSCATPQPAPPSLILKENRQKN